MDCGSRQARHSSAAGDPPLELIPVIHDSLPKEDNPVTLYHQPQHQGRRRAKSGDVLYIYARDSVYCARGQKIRGELFTTEFLFLLQRHYRIQR